MPTGVYYPLPLPQQTAYYYPSVPGAAPISERVSKQVVSLPMRPYLGEQMQARIIDAVREAHAD